MKLLWPSFLFCFESHFHLSWMLSTCSLHIWIFSLPLLLLFFKIITYFIPQFNKLKLFFFFLWMRQALQWMTSLKFVGLERHENYMKRNDHYMLCYILRFVFMIHHGEWLRIDFTMALRCDGYMYMLCCFVLHEEDILEVMCVEVTCLQPIIFYKVQS